MQRVGDCYTMNDGVKIPCMGFGTSQITDEPLAVQSVQEAVRAGYRHIDTAAIYGNERSVGRGVRQALEENGLNREDVFVTTKLLPVEHSYQIALDGCEASLKKLGLDYIDLYLIHWPKPERNQVNWEEALHEAWRGLETLQAQGKVRSIGVCNHTPEHLKVLLQEARVLPAVNQIELHPGFDQAATRAFCKEKGIVVEGWSPLGCGKIFELPSMQEIADKYHRTIAQICLRWALQNDILPLPKSVTPSRMRENTQIFDFELAAEDVETLTNLTGIGRTGPDPDCFQL